jgi:hypothetical protein
MTIDATSPLGTALVSSLDSYIRDDREQINLLWTAVVAANCSYTAHEMGLGEFSIEVGTDVEDVIIETIGLTAAGAVDLIQITDGSAGMVKIIKAGDGLVTVKHDASYIVLNGATDLTLTAGDILVLTNIGGSPSTSVNGVWYEVTRSGAALGEDNTASNVGTGTGEIYKQKTGVDLELKTLKEGTNITLVNNTSDVTISAAGGGSGTNSYTLATLGVGDTELIGGTDVTGEPLTQIVAITAGVAETLLTITNCTAGAILHLIAGDDNVSITRSASMEIRQPAADPTINLLTGDSITIMNIGGSPGVSDGVWYEVSRSLVVT